MKAASFLALLILLAGARPASASGTYCGACLPKPPKAASVNKDLNREKFELGQSLYLKTSLPDKTPVDEADQRAQLTRLQASLPERIRKKKDLTTLAGRLTPTQLDALTHYVNQRYDVKK